MRNFTNMTITLPPAPDWDKSNADVFIWKENYKDKKAQKTTRENDLKKAYTIVWGQFTSTLHSKIEAQPAYTPTKADQDVIALIRIIWALCCQFDSKLKLHYVLTQSLQWLLFYVQKLNVSNNDYNKDFEALVETIKTQGEKLWRHPASSKPRR